MKWVVMILMLLTGTARAAEIRQWLTPNGKDIQIRITGTIEFKDAELFEKQLNIAKLQGNQRVVVDLQSPGGNFMGGMLIAERIHDTNLTTWVREGKSCTSVCAIMWLAGFERFAKSTSLIGFHAAYDGTTGQETGKGNAILGSLLTKWGYDLEAVAFVTTAGPNDVLFLSVESATKYGIKFRGELPTEEYIQLMLQKHQSSPQTTTQEPTTQMTARDLATICWNKTLYERDVPTPKLYSKCVGEMFIILGRMDLESFSCIPFKDPFHPHLAEDINLVWYLTSLMQISIQRNARMGNLPAKVLVRRTVRAIFCKVDYD